MSDGALLIQIGPTTEKPYALRAKRPIGHSSVRRDGFLDNAGEQLRRLAGAGERGAMGAAAPTDKGQ